ncbi:hypothetical protein PSTT_13933 [Puccinia striiformis]|uniref:Uncharacterized protein n=1 Tax=Puccinia striiformis TaxID=27350 RepID=A0A2S4UPG1_9BASI|nr:hypothetical protein PSTT_13933 [Puccinia striiformis]
MILIFRDSPRAPRSLIMINHSCDVIDVTACFTSNSLGSIFIALQSDTNSVSLTCGSPLTRARGGIDIPTVSTVLCFLGDLPMHAEITSTPVPGNALHPCRACPLSATSVKAKATFAYAASFFMISATGSWQLCKAVWVMAHQPRKKTAVEDSNAKLGVKDSLNWTLIDRRYEILALDDEATAANLKFLKRLAQIAREDLASLFNPHWCRHLSGFDVGEDTPDEVLHVFLLGVVKDMVRDCMHGLTPDEKVKVKARYQLFNINSLNIASSQADYLTRHFGNFIGKDFRIVVQAALFVLFQYMDDDERHLWTALCKLVPLIFQTHIEDKASFTVQLTYHIRQFLYLLVKATAQWVNKPKLHMLLHLMESVDRYGPACLSATEKFEGYNSVVRDASVHSNQQSPGKDISVTFGDYRILRHILSGSYWVDGFQHEGTGRFKEPVSLCQEVEGSGLFAG